VGLPRLGLDFQQVLEQLAIVDHRTSEIFGRRFASSFANRNVVRNAIVLNHVAVVDGDVRCALLKVSDRIAAHLHQIRDEAIGFDDSALRVIDKPRLILAPSFRKVIAVLRREWTDLEVSHAVDALGQLGFGVPRIAMLSNEPFVFRSELRSKLICAALLREHERDDHHRERHQNANDYSGIE
jgi:hypothetical protein